MAGVMYYVDPSAVIHPLACVENAAVGARTRVWQFASVIRNAIVGADCKIASNAIVDGCRLGDRCLVSHGAFLDPGIRIGSDVFIGPHVALCNDIWPRVDKAGWFDMDKLISGEVIVTEIHDGASIGANAVLLPGVTIGGGAMIAAGAVVLRDVPSMHLWSRDGLISPIDSARIPDRRRAVAA